MRIALITAFLVALTCNLHAQFSTDKLHIRFGYNVHNTLARSVNHLVDDFNNDRYPTEVSENLNSVNFPMGFLFGADYAFRDDMIFYATFKNRRQFLSASYTHFPKYRQYLFRARTLDVGMVLPLREDDFFSHYVGGGLLLGVMEAHTAWTTEEKYQGSRKMISIDNSGIFGLSFVYEAQFRLHRNLRLFLRPVAQFSTSSPMRRLCEFFDPQVDSDGKVTYGPGEGEKYNKANFSGVGIEGGLLFLLPEF
ncbi:MAG: hypothetical protein U0176_20055 [Bacteroidia bacterium]